MAAASLVFLVLFLAATATLKQAAGRVDPRNLPVEKEAAATAGGVVVFLPPLPALPSYPPLPPLPSIPPFPTFPGFTPTPVSSSQPAHCMDPLTPVYSCVDYLTSATTAPTQICCQNFRELVNSNGSICLCHVITANPRLIRYINGTISQLRMLTLPFTCGSRIPLELLTYCFCT
jgi:hypothetical protein